MDHASRLLSALLPLSLCVGFACSGGTGTPAPLADAGIEEADADRSVPPEAIRLLLPGNQCPDFVDPALAADVIKAALASGDAVIGIATARVVEECSGAGGTHVFSSTTADGKRFWLGEHACYLPQQNVVTIDSGIIVGVGRQLTQPVTADGGWCLQYPGETEAFTSDISTEAMAWFANEAEAQRFIDSL